MPSTFQETENQVATDDRLHHGDQDVGESIQLHLVADKGLREIRKAENG